MEGPTAEPDESFCLVGGRRFYQRGDELIEAAVDRAPEARRVQIRFDSAEYFQLIVRDPTTLPAMRGARKVQLLLGNTIYEVVAA